MIGEFCWIFILKWFSWPCWGILITQCFGHWRKNQPTNYHLFIPDNRLVRPKKNIDRPSSKCVFDRILNFLKATTCVPLLTVPCPLQSVHSSPSPLSRSFGNTWAPSSKKSARGDLQNKAAPAPPYPSAPNASDSPKIFFDPPPLFLHLQSCWTSLPWSCGRQFAGLSEIHSNVWLEK